MHQQQLRQSWCRLLGWMFMYGRQALLIVLVSRVFLGWGTVRHTTMSRCWLAALTLVVVGLGRLSHVCPNSKLTTAFALLCDCLIHML